MQNSMMMFTFFSLPITNVLFGKICSKTVSLTLNLLFSLIPICEFKDGVHFFVYRSKTPVLGKFGPKCRHCQFKG